MLQSFRSVLPRRRKLWGATCLLMGLALLLTGCNGGNVSSTHGGGGSSPPLTMHVAHAFIVIDENHSYSSVIGNASMPYLNKLATTYAYGESYYANTHPSIGNYFMLTTGQIITNSDGFSGVVNSDNIVRHLIADGKTWKEYSEDLPFVGYTGGDTGGYVQHHNPLSYFSDVQGNSAQTQNLVPFTQLATDIANHTLPNFGFIVPNEVDNAHNGTLAQADSWLQTNIDPLIRSSDFQAPGGGLLIITFDESNPGDTADGGGQVAWIVVGPGIKKGYASTSFYQHENTLRFMAEALGLKGYPGDAASAQNMGEFASGK